MGHLRSARLLAIDEIPMVPRGLQHPVFTVSQVAIGQRQAQHFLCSAGSEASAVNDAKALSSTLLVSEPDPYPLAKSSSHKV